MQKCTSCGRGPSSELTPTASAASLGYAGLQAARRNTRFARYCEGNSLADAFILTTTLSLFTFAKYLTTTLYNAFLSIVISVGTEVFECKKYVMRAGPQLRVDAYGVSGFTRLCRSASSPSQHSFCTLLRRKFLGRRFIFTMT